MNKETTEVTSKLLRNKLAQTAMRLQSESNPQGLNPRVPTLEQVMKNSAKVLSEFYQKLSRPGFKPTNLLPDTLPDPEAYNDQFQIIHDDLSVAFAEFENLEEVVLGNFNYMVSRINRLNRKLKLISSNLGDYILLANLPTNDAIYFSDSFNNLSRVEPNSPLLNQEQCEINQVEGIVTLPVNRAEQVVITVSEVPVINSESNGALGNNEEVGAQVNDDITTILDNNPDTWFEYERVLSEDDGEPLVLDFTINLGTPKILNFVRINPNNFGTRTQVEIVNIDTSLDGNDFVSIKDDIPIAGFLAQDEENIFTLAPSTSKYAGQGLYTFTARQAKYVRLTLKQSTPYLISSESGQVKSRYAIGIRDVELQALPYKTDGEIISTEYRSNDEIKKVALLSNQNPDPATTSVLVAVDHFISPDNGVSWHQIRPKISAGLANATQDIPELLDFNGVADNSIETANPVFGLRYKAVLSRNTDAFADDSAELAQVLDKNTELHQVPVTSPFEFTLQKSALPDTIEVLDPSLGGRGKPDSEYMIATGNGGKLKVKLPLKNIKKNLVKTLVNGAWSKRKEDPEQIYVNGELWSRGALTGSNKHYLIDYRNGTIEFGDDTDGKAVPDKAVVSMQLTEERLYVQKGNPNYAQTELPFAKDKLRVDVQIVFPPETTTTELERDTTEHTLMPYIDSTEDITFSDATVFATEQTYVDGASELSSDGDYSINYTDGLLYSYSATAKSTITSVSYTYTPRNTLDPGKDDELGEWWFPRSNVKREKKLPKNAVIIGPGAYQTFKVTETVPAGTKYFALSKLNVVPGTVKFRKGDSISAPTELSVERQFQNGVDELRVAKRVRQPIGKHKRQQMMFITRWAQILASIIEGTYRSPTWWHVPYYWNYWIQWGVWKSNRLGLWRPLIRALNPEIPGQEEYKIKFPGLASLGYSEYTADHNDSIWPTWWDKNNQYWKLVYWKNPNDAADTRFFEDYYISFHHEIIPTEHDFQYIEYWRPIEALFKDQDKLYSVHYRTGEVFLRNPTTEDVTVTYEYTNYVVQYDLSREISEDDWEYNADERKVTVQDREMLQYMRTYRANREGQSPQKFYQISYEYVKQPRAVIDSIEPYFSPMLRDYALKVVTKSRLT